MYLACQHLEQVYHWKCVKLDWEPLYYLADIGKENRISISDEITPYLCCAQQFRMSLSEDARNMIEKQESWQPHGAMSQSGVQQ